ncbi:MAG: TIGR03663 family protein [Nanoarchaeota archaeon]|nr:TIGR03663 family protein [Nanoarchaeota archaeon]
MISRIKGMPDRIFKVIFLMIILFSILVRFYSLDNIPLHHDEAVYYSHYAKPIMQTGSARYLGTEYHGLFIHYIVALSMMIFGKSVWAMHFPAALFGVLTICLLIFLKEHIGKIGVLVSAAFLAVSPTFVFYSRRYQPHSFYIFFLLLFLIQMLRFVKEFKVKDLYLLSVLLAVLINIYETIVVELFIAGLFCYVYLFLKKEETKTIVQKIRRIKFMNVLLAIGIFVLVFSIIHTCLFFRITNFGPLFNAFTDISQKTVSTGHNKPFFYFILLAMKIEIGALIAGTLGFLFFRKKDFSVFVIFFTIMNTLIFSLISYKTNWMLTLVLFPWIILAGIAADFIFSKYHKARFFFVMFITLLIGINLFFSIQQNHVYANDFDKNKIGYVETSIDVDRLMEDLAEMGADKETRILVTLSDSWPLPYYLEKYADEYIKVDKLDFDEYPDYDIYIAEENQIDRLPQGFDKQRYELRENYYLVLLKRK